MIQFQHVSKRFGTQEILLDVSFTVHRSERAGLVGPNGAGKSTIFELITGSLYAGTGDVLVPQAAVIGHVRQQLRPSSVSSSVIEYTTDAVAELRGIEEQIASIEAGLESQGASERGNDLKRLGELQTRYEHLGGYELLNHAETALSGLGFAASDYHRSFRELSGGWQMRAELARTLVSRPDILLLDEPTNYLDVPAVEWLREHLRGFDGTLLLISHDRYLLNSLTTVTLEVGSKQVTRYPGNYEWYVREREQRHALLLAAKKNQDRRREQVERFVERFRAKNTKATQVQSRLKMLEKMEDIRAPVEVMRPERINLPAPPHCGVEVVRLEDAGVSYDNQRWVLRRLGLRIERGEKVAVVGLNGMGKTTLLRVVAGQMRLSEGSRKLAPGVVLGYQAQDFADVMDPERTVFDTARQAAADCSDGEVRGMLGGFRFSGDAVEKKVAVLSGGEKVRLALARLLLLRCNFLVLDEPTTHLDIAAREALEQALSEFPGTLCVVSHDVEFLRHIATGVLAMTSAGVKRYYGGYDYYREKLAQEVESCPTETASGGAPSTKSRQRQARKREDARRRQELYARRRPLEEQVAAAEQNIERLEQEQHRLVDLIRRPEGALDYEATNRRLAEIQGEIAEATEAWERSAVELETLLKEHDQA